MTLQRTHALPTQGHRLAMRDDGSLNPTPLAAALHAVVLGLGLGAALPSSSLAQSTTATSPSGAAIKTFNVPAGPLDVALDRFARTAGVNLSYDASMISGLMTQGLSGSYSISLALTTLLAGSGIEAIAQTGGGYVLHKTAIQTSAPATTNEPTLPVVSVTASSGSDRDDLPKVFAGGQVARGSSVGMLGDRSLYDTPFNITTVTSTGIADQQARSVGEALAGDASVRAFLPQTFMEQYTFRGFTVFNDDVSFNGLTGLMPISTIDAGAIERLEIFKGPSAMVSGVSSGQSIGGTMNIVSKRATDEPINQVSVDYASRSQLGTHLDMGRRFGEDKAWGFRFNGTVRDGDLVRDDSSQKTTNGVIALDYRGQHTRASIDAGTQKITSEGVGAFVVANSSLTSLPSAPSNRVNVFQPWMHVENVDHFVMGKIEQQLNDAVTIHASVGASRYEERQINATPQITNSAGDLTTQPYWRKDFGRRTAAEAGGTWHFSTGQIDHQVSLSFNYFDSISGDTYIDLPGGAVTSNLYHPLIAAKPNESSVGSMPAASSYTTLHSTGLADAIDVFSDKTLQLVAGARLQSIESGAITDNVRGQTYDESQITPMLGFVVRPNSVLSIYGNYVEALQQGDTVTAPYQNAGQTFAPFRSKQYELGTKWDFGRYGMTVDVFQISKPNEIATPSGALPAQQSIALAGEQRNRGLEVSMFGELMHGVRGLGGLMLLDGKLVRTQDGAQDGNQAVGAPRVNLNLGLEWDTPWLKGLTLNTGLIHTSSQYLNSGNTLSIPSWTTFDMGARYRTSFGDCPVMLRARLDNVFDRAYWASTARGFGMSYGQPRQLQVSATFDF
ncbi:MAG: TonB-dependent receptor [Aquabacterium sp.]